MSDTKMMGFLADLLDNGVMSSYFINEIREAVADRIITLPAGFICNNGDGQSAVITEKGKRLYFDMWSAA